MNQSNDNVAKALVCNRLFSEPEDDRCINERLKAAVLTMGGTLTANELRLLLAVLVMRHNGAYLDKGASKHRMPHSSVTLACVATTDIVLRL